MIRKRNRGVFIVWKRFQRRVEVLAPSLDLEIGYFYYPWEDKSRIFKALSYFLKSIGTIKYLVQKRPRLVFIQFPPALALYCVALYSYLTGSRYVSDCHIGLTNANWLKWMLVNKLLSQEQIIVHNEHLVEQVISSMDVKPFVLRDGISKRKSTDIGRSCVLDNLGLIPNSYVILPWSFSWDEPIKEVIEAARMLPEYMFVLTGQIDRLSRTIQNDRPSNVLLTGYLRLDDFDQLFAHSGIALVLTKHEAVQLSGMQEAMAFEIPAVVSDLKTTRLLYKNNPVYVRNNPNSIAVGIKYAFQNRFDLKEKMIALRVETEKEYFSQLEQLKASLTLLDKT